MNITSDFLMVRFTDISLLHILVLVGIPYIIFYFFERFTKFDKFVEKWEGALFIFSVGGFFSLIAILFLRIADIPFGYTYSVLLIYLALGLWIIKLSFYSNKRVKQRTTGWVRVKMKDGDTYIGNFLESDTEYIKLGTAGKEKIKRINFKSEEKALRAKEVLISKSSIKAICYY